MKYWIVISLWVFMLILMCADAQDLGYTFWTAFFGFISMNLYMQRHVKRLTKEVDEDFKEMT